MGRSLAGSPSSDSACSATPSHWVTPATLLQATGVPAATLAAAAASFALTAAITLAAQLRATSSPQASSLPAMKFDALFRPAPAPASNAAKFPPTRPPPAYLFSASSCASPSFFADFALITYSPDDAMIGMTSLVGPPGPATWPPPARNFRPPLMLPPTPVVALKYSCPAPWPVITKLTFLPCRLLICACRPSTRPAAACAL